MFFGDCSGSPCIQLMDKTLLEWLENLSKWNVFRRLVTSTLPNSATTSATTYAMVLFVGEIMSRLGFTIYHTFETRWEICQQ